MATRGKSSGKRRPARKARRSAARKATARRSTAPQTRARQAKRAASRRRAEAATGRPIVATPSSWSTLRIVWRPAIAMATLPYRVYRVYRWAEAQSHRSSSVGSTATA